MEKLESHTSKGAAWRSHLQRQEQRGNSNAAFCQDESVSTASFPIWQAKPAAASGNAAQLAQPAAFSDLDTIATTADVTSMGHLPASAPVTVAGIDVRINLSGGIVLTITRRGCSSLKAR